MKHEIHFTKMHGAGNDYIYVDTLLYNIGDPVAAAREWSDRHKGIGSDGLVLIGRSPISEADFTMRIFNADGSEAMMCGNASRCVGKYVYEKGLTTQTQIKLLTLSGIKVLDLLVREDIVESVTVDMGEPVFENERQFNPAAMATNSQALSSLTGGVVGGSSFVSMGNPHYVIFVDNVDAIDVAREGAILEHHPAFPERCNIEAVAACKTGRAGRASRIIMDGGVLEIEWREADGHVYMTGPAEFVFEGEIVPPSPLKGSVGNERLKSEK